MPEPETGKVSVELSDGVARIALDRPGQLNALNYDIRGQLAAGLRQALSNADTRVILILGSGTRAFAAGADVEELIDLTPEQSLDLSLSIERFHAEIEMAPLPVVACIRGWCLGGGLELALAADIRVASNTAKFGLPEITLGILPGGGGVARLSRIAGTAAARHLCLTGRIIDAERAHRLGIVSEVYPDAEFDSCVNDLAASMSALSKPAVKAMKAALLLGSKSQAAAVAQEARIGAGLYGSPAQKQAMADFLAARAKRKVK